MTTLYSFGPGSGSPFPYGRWSATSSENVRAGDAFAAGMPMAPDPASVSERPKRSAWPAGGCRSERPSGLAMRQASPRASPSRARRRGGWLDVEQRPASASADWTTPWFVSGRLFARRRSAGILATFGEHRPGRAACGGLAGAFRSTTILGDHGGGRGRATTTINLFPGAQWGKTPEHTFEQLPAVWHRPVSQNARREAHRCPLPPLRDHTRGGGRQVPKAEGV
jgi:hypothetical protein